MNIATADDGGLICGFRLGPVQACGAEALKPDVRPASRPIWLHFNMADLRARRWLEDASSLPRDVAKSLLESDPRSYLETAGDGMVAVLSDLHHDFDRDPEGFGKIRVYVDAERMITVRRQRLQTADRLRRDLASGAMEAATTAELFQRFVEHLADAVAAVVGKLGDEVDIAEDEILSSRYQQQGSVLGRVRRSIARLRRHMNANRAALAMLRGRLPAALQPAHDGLRDALARMDAIAQDLELVQERTRLLQEEIAGRLGEATNRSLAVLSMVTTALLPITLITGIFGMNVGGLPGVNDPHGFKWVMMSILAAIAVALVMLVRRRR